MAAYTLGIDLGTTYTAAATARQGRVEVVQLGNRAAAVPTVVFFGEDGVCKVGEAAEPRGISQPGRFAREFKRRLGDTTPLLLGGTAWSPEALLGEVLRHVVDVTAEREGGPPDRIGLTHPANWGPYKLDLLTQAVRLAGLKVDRYLSEPEAAAFAYAHHAAERVPVGSVIAVYDLGGGTFDATVLRVAGSGFEILGNPEGIERLGGIDVDEMVLAHVRASLGGALDEIDLGDPAVLPLLARVRADCVIAKEQLSNDTDVQIPVTLPNVQTSVRLTRAELEAAIAVPIDQTIAALRRAIASASMTPQDLHAVLLVGGSSRMPIVADAVGAATGRPVAIDAHPKFGVAMGAALAAAGSDALSAAAPAAAPATAEPTVTRVLTSVSAGRSSEPAAVAAAPPQPTAPTPPAAPLVTPAAAAGAPPAPGSNRSVKVLAGVAAGFAVVAALLAGVLIGRGGNEPFPIQTAAGAVAPTGVVPCPTGSTSAVCIDSVSFEDGRVKANFASNVELASPVDGAFPADSLHPIFFVDSEGPEQGEHWGKNSPFFGISPAGFESFDQEDLSADSTLCVVLAQADGTWLPDTGNCVPAPN